MNKFNGTSVSREHIGSKASENLEALIHTPGSEFAALSITEGAEGDVTANQFDVAVQAQSLNGDDLAEPLQIHVRIYDANMIEAAAAAARVVEVSGATLDTPADQAAGLFTLGADGAGVIGILDQSGVLAGNLIVSWEVVGRPGVKYFTTLTYA